MHIHMHKVEVFVDRIIPFSLFALALIIGIEIYYPKTAEQYHQLINLLDGSIIGLFVIDLLFKYQRVRNIPLFFKSYWLEILAIMPFAMVLRSFEYFLPLMRILRFRKYEKITDPAMETASKWGVIVREAEMAGKASRVAVAHSVLRPIAKAPRLVQALTFYERPTGRHHSHDWNFVPNKKASRL
jgi:hypothetical protein